MNLKRLALAAAVVVSSASLVAGCGIGSSDGPFAGDTKWDFDFSEAGLVDLNITWPVPPNQQTYGSPGDRQTALYSYVCSDFTYPVIDAMCDTSVKHPSQTPAVARGASFDIVAHRHDKDPSALTVVGDDPTIVERGPTGTLTARAEGKTALLALDDGKEIDRRTIEVVEPTGLRGGTELTVAPGGDAWISVTPVAGTRDLAGRFFCEWSTDDATIAFVDPRLGRAHLHAGGKGTTTVTASCLGRTATFLVHVE